ncbi:MAG TPA: ATP-binding protein [Pseudonocardiaceae bacterium]|nr:ATP-binding protein [Pseudonocardiaceae bacterium]
MAVTDESGDRPAGESVTNRAWAVVGMAPRAELLSDVRAGLRGWLAELGLTDEQIDVIVLCVDEAASNAVEHAYADTTGTIDIRATRAENPDAVMVTVSDRGSWRTPREHTDRGRGLAMIRALAGRLDMDTGPAGTTVTMAWPTDAMY